MENVGIAGKRRKGTEAVVSAEAIAVKHVGKEFTTQAVPTAEHGFWRLLGEQGSVLQSALERVDSMVGPSNQIGCALDAGRSFEKRTHPEMLGCIARGSAIGKARRMSGRRQLLQMAFCGGHCTGASVFRVGHSSTAERANAFVLLVVNAQETLRNQGNYLTTVFIVGQLSQGHQLARLSGVYAKNVQKSLFDGKGDPAKLSVGHGRSRTARMSRLRCLTSSREIDGYAVSAENQSTEPPQCQTMTQPHWIILCRLHEEARTPRRTCSALTSSATGGSRIDKMGRGRIALASA